MWSSAPSVMKLGSIPCTRYALLIVYIIESVQQEVLNIRFQSNLVYYSFALDLDLCSSHLASSYSSSRLRTGLLGDAVEIQCVFDLIQLFNQLIWSGQSRRLWLEAAPPYLLVRHHGIWVLQAVFFSNLDLILYLNVSIANCLVFHWYFLLLNLGLWGNLTPVHTWRVVLHGHSETSRPTFRTSFVTLCAVTAYIGSSLLKARIKLLALTFIFFIDFSLNLCLHVHLTFSLPRRHWRQPWSDITSMLWEFVMNMLNICICIVLLFRGNPVVSWCSVLLSVSSLLLTAYWYVRSWVDYI